METLQVLKQILNLDNSMIAKSSRIDHQELYLKLGQRLDYQLISNNNLGILKRITKNKI